MKTINLFIFGALSCLLLTVGLVRIAQTFDPVVKNPASSQVRATMPAPDCTSPCLLV